MSLLICGPGPLEVGDQISRLTSITDEEGVPADTTTFEFKVRLPDHTVVDAVITHPDVGEYLALLPVFTQHGVHRWKAIGSGLINVVEQGSFTVKASLF